ncbi:uncharacterized protein LOC135701395 [Ochlerotatus camptorhynchus]|uniref:uncharacterized protein LOC135701395 n=1 Tax=Ochlerotatus camptorhynchus TaxID=644619 RepID=UPI0031D7736B
MEMKRVRVTHHKQFAFLVDRMEAHPSVVRGQKFCEVWIDHKNTIKQKLSYNNREAIATGGGPNTTILLSPNEDAVVKLLFLDKTDLVCL